MQPNNSACRPIISIKRKAFPRWLRNQSDWHNPLRRRRRHQVPLTLGTYHSGSGMRRWQLRQQRQWRCYKLISITSVPIPICHQCVELNPISCGTLTSFTGRYRIESGFSTENLCSGGKFAGRSKNTVLFGFRLVTVGNVISNLFEERTCCSTLLLLHSISLSFVVYGGRVVRWFDAHAPRRRALWVRLIGKVSSSL